MSLLTSEERRAYFAGLAMQSLLNRADLCDLDREDLARDAWRMADAMMSEEVEDRDSPLFTGSTEPTEGLKNALKRRR